MAGSKHAKVLAEAEVPKSVESALLRPAKSPAPEETPKKGTQQESNKSTAHKYVSFPPFPGKANDEKLPDAQKEQQPVEAESLKEIQKQQPSVEVESSQQEPLNEPKPRPRRASHLWFWHGK